jgi:hypothetical protein
LKSETTTFKEMQPEIPRSIHPSAIHKLDTAHIPFKPWVRTIIGIPRVAGQHGLHRA